MAGISSTTCDEQNAPGRPLAMFETAASVLRQNIDSGRLYAGLVLQESGLSERLGMSRASV